MAENVDQTELWLPIWIALHPNGGNGPYNGYYSLRCPECKARAGNWCGGSPMGMRDGVCVLRVKYWQLMGFPAHPEDVTELAYKMAEAVLSDG